MDPPGFGLSPALGTATAPTTWALADAVERFVAELELTRPHVAGNSLGGGISLELARRGAVASATALSPGRVPRVLPSARMVWLGNGCGHVPMWDDPPGVERVLLEGSG